MTIFKATCPSCGEVDLKPEAFKLRIPIGAESTYTFVCPLCISTVSKPADSRVIQLLISAGVKPDFLESPPESSAPAFTYDDLLDFHLQLQSDYVVESLLRSAQAEA